MKNRRAFLVAWAIFGFSIAIYGQQTSAPNWRMPVERQTYGTADIVTYTMTSSDFAPDSSSTSYVGGDFGKYVTSGGGYLQATPKLPEGASVVSVELEACTTNFTSHVTGFFGNCPAGSGCTHLQDFSSSFQSGGCDLFPLTLASPHTVDNRNNRYIVEWTDFPGDGSAWFVAFRIFYKLQISPAPSTARFNDVPTSHPFFQYVEALAAAGITAGCGTTPPMYCPDSPLTRGQMAVFLARSLGLHWTP